jgi:pyruvate, water dikinase
VDSLLWLDRLQETDEAQAGTQLLSLSQLLQAGCPGENGLIIPDRVMQTVWRQINWPTEILQDFPYLNLNVSLSEAAQVQFLAQTLQQGILAQVLPPTWAAEWQQGLSRWRNPALILTAYLWIEPKEKSTEAAKMLFLKPSRCDLELNALWVSLKNLWAQLLQAQNLHILGYLGLRPDRLRLSVLVQPLAPAQASGWLQIGHHSLSLEAVSQVDLGPWQGERWPDCYLYDRRAAQWVEPFTPCGSSAPSSQSKQKTSSVEPNLLSAKTLQALVDIAASVPSQAYADVPLTLAWVLPKASSKASPKLLGFVQDLPLPLHPSLQSLGSNRSTSDATDRDDPSQPLGLGASPGRIAAPVIVVQSFDRVSPSACQGKILVVHRLEPTHLAWLKEAVGLLCETGGITSHGAILARELGCPAIVGLCNITKILQTGQRVSMDGKEGRVYGQGAEGVDLPPLELAPPDRKNLKPFSTATQLLANLSQLSGVKKAQTHGIDGIGVVRGEWLLLSHLTAAKTLESSSGIDYQHLEQHLGATLTAMAQAVAPQPIYYRSIDCPPNWEEQSPPLPDAQNPSLGLRGTLRHRYAPRLFEMELAVLAALLRQGVKNLRFILPFVRSPAEVAFCVEKMGTVGLDARSNLPLWIMAEVPSVLFSLEQYQQVGIQGIAIGSNDLAQLFLGIDRDRADFMDILNQNRSALETVVLQLVQKASALGLSSILCGDLLLAQQPHRPWLSQLIEAGLTGIAVELDAIAQTRRAIAQAERLPSIQSNRSVPNPTPNPALRDKCPKP